MPIKKSLYEVTEHSRDSLLNTGFDYHGRIFEKTMSPLLLSEDKRAGILAKLEEVYYELIERVKVIKTFYDFSKHKNYRKFN